MTKPDTPLEPFMRDGKTPKCQEAIMRYVGNWPQGLAQCTRSAKVGDRCRQHDPVFIAKKEADRTVKYNNEWAARRKEIHGAAFYNALELIAAGHNDPRTLATEMIDKFKEGR